MLSRQVIDRDVEEAGVVFLGLSLIVPDNDDEEELGREDMLSRQVIDHDVEEAGVLFLGLCRVYKGN